MRTKNNLVLSIDIGTTFLKTALIDAKGNTIAFSRKRLTKSNAQNNISNLWLVALKDCVFEIKELLPQISALCVSGNGPTLVSDDGTTLLWNDTDKENCNTKTTSNTARPLLDKSPLSLFMPRLILFKKKYHAIWNVAQTIFSGPEYLIWRLTSKKITALPEARYKSAYWEKEMFFNNSNLNDGGGTKKNETLTQNDFLKLPPFINIGTFIGEVTQDAAHQTGLLQGIKVFAGGPDFTAALVGTNTLTSGAWCDRAGSSEGINLCSALPVYENNLRTLPSCIQDLWNVSYLIPQSGAMLADYADSPARFNDFILNAWKNKSSKENTALTFLLNKFVYGIKLIEGVAKKSNIKTSDTITVTGGQANSQKLLQLKSSLSGKKIALLPLCDAELLGDAILARFGLGEYNSIQEAAAQLVRIEKIFKP